MRAGESCRPSAMPLKVGRKPKLTSNKVFEVVRGGSWGNCLLRGEAGGEKLSITLVGCPVAGAGRSGLGPVAGRGQEADPPTSLQKLPSLV